MSKNVVDMTLRANMDLSQVSSGLNQMQGILKQLKLSPTLKKEFDSLFSTAATDLEKYQAKLQSGFKTKGDITGFEKIAQNLQGSLSSLEKEWSKLQAMDLGEITRLDSNTINQIKQIEEAFKRITSELQTKLSPQIEQVEKSITKLTTTSSKNAGKEILGKLNAGQIKEAEKALDSYIAKQEKALQTFGKKKGVLEDGTPEYDLDDSRTKSLANTLNIYNEIKKQIDNMTSSLGGYNQEASKLKTDKLTIMAEATDKTNQKLQQGSTIISGVTQKTQEYSRAVLESGKKTVELGNDIDMLKNRVSYFFSLTNSVMLFRRILQDTIQTTKELDAAMTETAVVTDFSVADMWKELPRYTEAAKELGATIQGVYETTTLYYQQGLKTNEVFEVGTETLKMAKIAGLDYAQATDFMTAALRGFNMEVNELNAQKVNDVYSELAAITAADTQEIATAMTKTASIASSANMEFETTAAFLSQIIETTRESAETAGTAMKTVIARFTELKKDPAEIGEVDGEIVDANKIETALRTIDVALRDTSGQFRDLDEVFLDIAEKWDGLDTNTQRYIATMAAGSRQQSRFIAMMSDYDRTMQLVSAANNSAGASQKQFDKTLESLEAKLNKLGAAWDQFTMGIANNTLIKAGVDALTGLLNIINKITEHLPGATKGIGNLLLMIGGFTAGKKVMDAFFASTVSNIANLGKAGEKGGATYGITFREALSKEFGKTKQTFLNFKKELSKDADSIYNLTKNTKIDKQELKNLEKQKNKISGNLSKVGTPERIQQDKEILDLEEKINAVKQKNIATQELENALGTASREQKAMYLALQQQEISQDLALQALGKDLNDEELQTIVLKALGYEAQDLENEAIKEEVAAKMAAIKTKQQEIVTEKMGLLTKAKNIALLLSSNVETRKEAAGKLEAAGCTWAAKFAQDSYNWSLLGYIAIAAIAVAAVIALGVALYSLYQNAKENSLEYKMEKAAEATEKAKEAAEQAKQAYDDLNSSIESINNKEDAFENLTYGTLEWQKALLEVNQEIMDLIDQFPELKDQLLNELSVEASGKLTLSTDGYNIIKEQSLQYYKNALAGQNIAASYEAALQKEKAEKNFETVQYTVYETNGSSNEPIVESKSEQAMDEVAAVYANYNTSASQLQQGIESLKFLITGEKSENQQIKEQIQSNLDADARSYLQARILNLSERQEIYDKYLEKPEIFSADGNAELQALADKFEITTESILDFIPVMDDLKAAGLEYESSIRTKAQNLLLSTTSNDFQTRENSKQLADTFSQFFVKQQENDVEAELNKMNSLANISDYASELGLTNFFDQGSELENLREMYQRLTGFSEEKIEEMYGESTDALKNAIASIKVGKDWGQRVENFAKELDDFTKDLPKGEKLALEQLFGGAEGTGFTQEGLAALGTMMKSSEDGEISDLEKFFNENETIKTQFADEYGEEEAYNKFYEWATEMLGLGTEAFTAAKERLESIGFTDVENFGSTLDSGAVSALSKKIEEVFYRSGEEGASALMTGYNEIINSFDGDETAIKKFTSALLALDWNSASDIEDFGEILKELGVVVDDVELKEFTSDLIEFNEASSAINLENLNAQLEDLDSIRKQLEDKEYDDFEFTREEKDKLTEIPGINESDFAGYGDSWRYLGDSIGDLITAVNENTAAIIGDTIDELEQQRATAAFLGDEQVNTGNLANYSFEGAEGRGNILASLMNQLTNYNAGLSDENKLTQLGGYDLGSLATLLSKNEKGEYVANENLDSYQQDKLTEVLGELAALLGQEGVLENKIAATKEENAIRQYDNQPVQNVISDATQERTEENADEINAATTALLYKAKGYTQLNDEVKEYNRLMKEGKIAEADAAKKVIATGVAIAENAKKIDKYSDKIQDNISSLEDMNDEGGAYQETLEDTATLVNEMMDADIDASFFSGDGAENLQLLQDGLDGSQEAWNNFVLNMQNAKIQAAGFADQFGVSADQILAAVSSLDASSFDIDGTADMTQVVQSLLNAGMTGEEVATFLELLGYTNIELSVDNNITGLEELAEGTDLSALGGSVTVSAVNSYVPAASMANSFGGGSGSSGGGGGGGGGSGGDSGSEEQPWENSFDKFYNITEDINELLEKRNELETEYDLILQDQNASIDDYLKNYTDRIKSFKEEIALQEEMLRLREKDQEEILSEYSHLSEYAWVEDGKVQIDYDAINQVEDQELGEEIEEFVSKLEENDDAIQEANDAIQENTLAIEELLDDWRDATADFEQRVFDAIVAEREKEIEKLEEASDALENSNSDLISAIQKEIDERRQQRENEETEQDLAEKERRLAYLQQDTSGAYDTEILQLEKDLKQQKEDYTDTLIDQRIADLEQQNDEAAKQREKQIQIAQYQLKNEQENGVIARQVSQLLKEANSEAGWNRVWRLLEKSEGFSGLTETNKLVWTDDTQSEFKNAMAYLNGTSGGGIAAALANISVGSYESYVDPASNSSGDGYDPDEAQRKIAELQKQLTDEQAKNYSSKVVAVDKIQKGIDGVEYYQIKDKWYKSSDTTGLDQDEGTTTLKDNAKAKSFMGYSQDLKAKMPVFTANAPLSTETMIKQLQTATASQGTAVSKEKINGIEFLVYTSNLGKFAYKLSDLKTDVSSNGQYQWYFNKGVSVYKQFKTGGLADYTGPAWLDGTKSKPELVLNQKDTQNFLKLKDVLGSFMKQNSTIVNSESTGDTIYDISISVEKMSSDYDVEQVASKIKQMITNDAAYRNSTMIQRLR